MDGYCLSAVSDVDVVARLKALVGQERGLIAAVLAHIGEVEARQLFLPAGCSSMFGYCMRVLGMSEDEAYKRIQAARAARRHPAVMQAVVSGALHLSGVVMIAPHLDGDSADELVAEASGKSKAEIAVVLSRRAPQPDVPTRIAPVTQQTIVPELVPEPVPQRATVAPLAPERFALQVTINGATQEKLMRAQALLRHQVPSGDVAEVLERALDALLDRIEKRKFGATKAPRVAKKATAHRYVPRAARRAAVARDGQRCAFVSEDGRRCEETGFLELDHVTPVACGGSSSDVRILCTSHNKYEAERVLGKECVEKGRRARDLERDVMSALQNLGVTPPDAKAAVSECGGDSIEERLRSALRALRTDRRRPSRCEERPGPMWNVAPRRATAVQV